MPVRHHFVVSRRAALGLLGAGAPLPAQAPPPRRARARPGRRPCGVPRRGALGLPGAGAPLLAQAPAPARAQSPPRLDRVSFVTNWRAQAEHGGFYQAQAAGLYRRAGLEVELRTGGPQITPGQVLIAGRGGTRAGWAL